MGAHQDVDLGVVTGRVAVKGGGAEPSLTREALEAEAAKELGQEDKK